MEKKPKVALGMSGGVDSSLSAHLLVEAGYEVTGVYLECWRAPGCRTEEDRADALKVALGLGIKFEVLDFKQQYKDRVVEYFFKEYEAGRTPNPDVMCNKEIKFGMFYDWAMEKGFDFVATGHYAQIGYRVQGLVESKEEKTAGIIDQLSRSRITVHEDLVPLSGMMSQTETKEQSKLGELALCIPADTHKDQTYFLYRLRQEQLAHILFPIGHLTKDQVRSEAKKRQIAVANKPDSQGICFIGEINVHNFLKERLGKNPGEVVNTAGEVIGRHNGLWFYTVGQRHGFEIDGTWKSKQGELKHAMPPYYVIKKIPEKNQLVVGFGTETYQKEFRVDDMHWIGERVPYSRFNVQKTGNNQLNKQPTNLFVRIRHGGKLIPCTFQEKANGTWHITLNEPTQGIAEGQSAVLYVKNNHTAKYICMGGGALIS